MTSRELAMETNAMLSFDKLVKDLEETFPDTLPGFQSHLEKPEYLYVRIGHQELKRFVRRWIETMTEEH